MSDMFRTWRCHPEGLTEKIELRVTLRMWKRIEGLARCAGVTVSQYTRSALAENLAVYDLENEQSDR